MKSLNTGQKASRSGELLCKHKGEEEPPPQFAYGLCNQCYKDVISQPIIDHFDFIIIFIHSA